MRSKELLDDAVLRSEVADGLPERLAAFFEPYAEGLGRKDRVQTCLRVVGCTGVRSNHYRCFGTR